MTNGARDKVDRISSTLRVVDKRDHGDWRIWTIRGDQIFDTWVVQGPQSIVLTGDGASAVFERPGGLGLGLAAGALDYAGQKCRAGQIYGYDGDQARVEIEADLNQQITEAADQDDIAAADRIRGFKDELDDLDFGDENGINAWYLNGPGEGGDYPYFGRVFDSDFLRAVACVLAVYRFEVNQPTEPATVKETSA